MVEKNSIAEQMGERTVTNLGCEDSLLIHCARLDMSHERYQMIKDLLAGELDWDLLVQKATWHRLLLMVSYHLRSPELRMSVPKPILERMKTTQYSSLARNMVLQDELSRLLTIFKTEEIPVIVLKGAALLESIYTDISLRPMNDLDILVPPEYINHAEAIALGRGYVYTVDREVQEKFRKDCHQLPFLVHSQKSVVLEIHQHFVDSDDPFRFSLSGFWTRARPFTTLGAHALALAPEDLLIHLSIKFLLDRRYQSSNALGQLCDISEVIKYYGDSLNWSLIEKTSRENGALNGLHFVLYTCRHLLQTPVPATVLDKFQPREFNPASAELFIRRRVLDTKPWLAHGLLDSQLAFSRRRMVQAIIGRVFSFTKDIMKKNGNGNNTELSNWRRVRDILLRLLRVLIRPANLKDDLKLDRWLHDLCSTN